MRNLSGGQARRVEIARSMLHRPGLLLLDEATVGLDIGSRESVIGIVRGLVAARRPRRPLGHAPHRRDRATTDLVVVLHKGRVLFNGTVPDLLAATGAANPRDAFRNLTGTTARGGGMNVDVVEAHGRPGDPTAPRAAGLFRLLPRHRLARGSALSASARALLLRPRAPARLALHLRRRLPPGARRLDHPAVRDLRSLRGLRRARASLGMILLFNAMQSSLSMVYDRETGAMRTLLVSPFPRSFLLLSKLLGGVAVAAIQAYVFLGIFYFWEADIPLRAHLLLLAAPALLCALLIFNATTEVLSETVIQSFIAGHRPWSSSRSLSPSSITGSSRHLR